MNVRFFVSLFLVIVLGGCIRGHKMRHTFGHSLKSEALSRVSIGMTKDDVKVAIGRPDIVRGSIINDNNQIIEVWEYYVLTGGSFFYPETLRTEGYLLYFNNNILVSWGKGGDWKDEANKIKAEISFG